MAVKGESSSGPRKFNQPALKPAPSQAISGAVSFDEPDSFRGSGQGRSPHRRGSPGGIMLNRHPKLRLGNNRQKQVGSKKGVRMADTKLPAMAVSPQPSSPGRADLISNRGYGEEQPTGVHAETRHRRLLLEDDSDDDMVDVAPLPTSSGLGVKLEGAPMHPKNFIAPPAPGALKPGKGKARRSKDPPRRKAGGRAELRRMGEVNEATQLPEETVEISAGQAAASGAPRMGNETPMKRKPSRAKNPLLQTEVDEAPPGDDSMVEVRKMKSKPVASRGRRLLLKTKSAKEMAEGMRDVDAKVGAGLVDYEQPDPDNQKGVIEASQLADSESEESAVGAESQNFMIKKRSPIAAPRQHCSTSTGRVSQVVAAFEGGLTIADEGMEQPMGVGIIDVPGSEETKRGELDAGSFDEYGSNMLIPPPGVLKRPLEVVEGELGIPPTPKKQFVEVDEDPGKVEVASLEWPQPDK
ncbi:unnamed protein product [Linum trigynum]